MTRYVFALDGYVPKNRRYQAVGKPHPRIITTREYRAWLSTVAEQVKRRGLPRLDRGRWRLTVWTIAPTLRHLDVDVPHIDSDASLSAAKDACAPPARQHRTGRTRTHRLHTASRLGTDSFSARPRGRRPVLRDRAPAPSAWADFDSEAAELALEEVGLALLREGRELEVEALQAVASGHRYALMLRWSLS